MTIAKNYKKNINRTYEKEGLFKGEYYFPGETRKEVVKIPHISVLTPSEDEIIAVGPKIIDGADVVTKIDESVHFNKVRFIYFRVETIARAYRRKLLTF